VQVMPVSQPSEWQQSFARFTEQQLELLRSRETSTQP